MSGDGPKVPNTSAEPPGRDDWRITFRPDIPSSARIYDYFLGGKDNYPADRDAGGQITAYLSAIREARHRFRRVWRPEPGEQVLARPSDGSCYALVARKP